MQTERRSRSGSVVVEELASGIEAEFFAAGDAPPASSPDDGFDLLAPHEPPAYKRRRRPRGALLAIVAATGVSAGVVGWMITGPRAQSQPALQTALLVPPRPAPAAPPPPEPALVAPAPEPKPEPAPPPAAPAEDDARLAKRQALRAFERGDVATALTAGERATTLDPSDAEAWLVLGAAQQRRGQDTLARRTFRECVKQARRGPRDECVALAR